MKQRRSMELEDWMSASFNVLIGLFLGLALEGLMRLVLSGFWLLAVATIVPFLGLYLFMSISDWLIGRRVLGFPLPPRGPHTKDRPPLIRLLSLPAGIASGVVLAQFGLTNAILGLMDRLFGTL